MVDTCVVCDIAGFCARDGACLDHTINDLYKVNDKMSKGMISRTFLIPVDLEARIVAICHRTNKKKTELVREALQTLCQRYDNSTETVTIPARDIGKYLKQGWALTADSNDGVFTMTRMASEPSTEQHYQQQNQDN